MLTDIAFFYNTPKWSRAVTIFYTIFIHLNSFPSFCYDSQNIPAVHFYHACLHANLGVINRLMLTLCNRQNILFVLNWDYTHKKYERKKSINTKDPAGFYWGFQPSCPYALYWHFHIWSSNNIFMTWLSYLEMEGTVGELGIFLHILRRP